MNGKYIVSNVIFGPEKKNTHTQTHKTIGRKMHHKF